MTTLYQLSHVWELLRERQANGEDWHQAVDDLEENIETKCQNIGKLIRNDEAEAEALEIEAKRLNERARALRGSVAGWKDYLATHMEAVGLAHVRGIVDIKLQKSPPSVVTTEELPTVWVSATLKMKLSDVPDHWRAAVKSAQPDKMDLLNLWRDGGQLPPGATVVTDKKHVVLR